MASVIQLDVRHENTCCLVNAQTNWTWVETARYIQNHILDGGLLVPTPDRPADYVLVRPERDGEKWTALTSPPLTLAQASSLHPLGEGGPYQLRLYKADAVIVVVEDQSTHKLREFSFENNDQKKTVEEFVKMVKTAILCEDAQIAESTDEEKKKKKMCDAFRKKRYVLDAGNSILLQRYMAVGHEDKDRMPVIHMEIRIECSFADRLSSPAIRKTLILAVGLMTTTWAIEHFCPHVSDFLLEKCQDLYGTFF